MKYVAIYMLFSISSFLVMAFLDLPDRFFGIMVLIVLAGGLYFGIKKLRAVRAKKKIES